MGIRGKKGKSPPFFSQEFIIQNHGDIVSCVCMVVMVGLMFQATQPLAQLFIAAQHNVTKTVEGSDERNVLYNVGGKDVLTILFYTLCWIVVQAIIQEYILDKLSRRLHMSKTKTSKFNDSGNLLPFFILSIGVGVDLIIKHNIFQNFTKLWEGYPHGEMDFVGKFFFILQIAYWLHLYPELYFTKARKEELAEKITMYTLYFLFISAAYVMSGSQIALVLLTIHYIPEAIFHATRLVHCAGKLDLSAHGFLAWAVFFVLARLATVILAILIVWFGLGKSGVQQIDLPSSNFNTQLVRIAWVAAITLSQAWMAWNFIVFQMKRYRESAAGESATKKNRAEKEKERKKQKKDKKGTKEEESPSSNGSAALRPKQD